MRNEGRHPGSIDASNITWEWCENVNVTLMMGPGSDTIDAMTPSTFIVQHEIGHLQTATFIITVKRSSIPFTFCSDGVIEICD